MSSFPEPSRHTRRLVNVQADDFDDFDSIVVIRSSTEDRGRIPVWAAIENVCPGKVLSVEEASSDSFSLFRAGVFIETVFYSDISSIGRLVGLGRVLIDVSGMDHSLWASLLRCMFINRQRHSVAYVEPFEYKRHKAPSSDGQFDLSEKINGISPLPGFAKISNRNVTGGSVLVVFSGFEGNRALSMAAAVEPAPKVIPVVGFPGFQAGFSGNAIAANAQLISQYNAHSNIRYVRASCPFAARAALKEVAVDNPHSYVYIGLVGTKPHAVGAVRYALEFPNDCELIFDHPERKTGRTGGVGSVHIYEFC